jgi:hypothetical protein
MFRPCLIVSSKVFQVVFSHWICNSALQVLLAHKYNTNAKKHNGKKIIIIIIIIIIQLIDVQA